MEALKALTKDFDPAALMPDLSTFLGKLETVMRIAVLAAPLVLLGLGLLYLLAAPKEANYKLGYRFYWGMSSVEAWRFTQRLAGAVWTLLGLTLYIVMTTLSGKFQGMELDAMTYAAIKYILWELGSVAVSILLINVTVLVFFDHRGVLRPAIQAKLPQPRRRGRRRAPRKQQKDRSL